MITTIVLWNPYRSRSAIFRLAGKASSSVSSILVFLAYHKTARRILSRFTAFVSLTGAVSAVCLTHNSFIINTKFKHAFYKFDYKNQQALANQRGKAVSVSLY